MPRCPNGSRKNKKTGDCDSITSKSSPAAKGSPAVKGSPVAKSSPAAATKKVRKAAKAKVYLDDSAIDYIINSNMETIEYKGVSRDKMKEVLSKVYYKPRFESEFYDGSSIKRRLKKNKASADDIIDELLAEQAYALIREWGKSYIRLSDFTSSESFYSHSS